jgi:DNA polymerase elongation subunit (family B)
MLKNIALENILCLDIETVPQYKSYEEVPEEVRPLWKRKADNLKKEDTEDHISIYDRAGIYAEFGKIICISTGFLNHTSDGREFRMKSFYGHDEKELLEDFAQLLHKLKPTMLLCGHNGKEFDFPYLSRRMIINGIELPPQLDNSMKKPWEVPHLDTMELWKFGDYKSYTPLNLLANVLGIPSPKDDIDGSQVGKVYWNENNLDRIVTYCRKDVITVMQILLRFKGQELLDEYEVKLGN